MTDPVKSKCAKCKITTSLEELGYKKDSNLGEKTGARKQKKKPRPENHEKEVIDLKQLQQYILTYTANIDIYIYIYVYTYIDILHI